MILLMEEARATILKESQLQSREDLPLKEAYGRFLAQDEVLSEPLPMHPISNRDGYALCSLETRRPPSILKVVGRVRAGEVPTLRVQEGEAMAIMTGAMLPEGADAIIEEERVLKKEEGILPLDSISKGRHVTRRGSHLRGGERIRRGSRIHPLSMNLLATRGQERVKVFKRPRTAIITTGDELVELGEKVGLGKIPNSNAYFLAGLVEEAGGLPHLMRIAKDSCQDLVYALNEGLQYDLIITTGGVGGGDHDYMEEAWENLGISPLLTGVQARPGRRFLYGLHKKRHIFSLPGSPGALQVLFLELIRPLLRSMQGGEEKEYGRGILRSPVKNRGYGTLYHMGTLKEESGRLSILPSKERSFLSSSLHASLLFLVPEGAAYKAGDRVLYLSMSSKADCP